VNGAIARPLDETLAPAKDETTEEDIPLPDTLLQADWNVLSQLCAGPTLAQPETNQFSQASQKREAKQNQLMLLGMSLGVGALLAVVILVVIFILIR